jgi:hypothetical protein
VTRVKDKKKKSKEGAKYKYQKQKRPICNFLGRRKKKN